MERSACCGAGWVLPDRISHSTRNLLTRSLPCWRSIDPRGPPIRYVRIGRESRSGKGRSGPSDEAGHRVSQWCLNATIGHATCRASKIKILRWQTVLRAALINKGFSARWQTPPDATTCSAAPLTCLPNPPPICPANQGPTCPRWLLGVHGRCGADRKVSRVSTKSASNTSTA